MEITALQVDPRTVHQGGTIHFSFQVMDAGLKDSSGNLITDSSGGYINRGLLLEPV